MNHISREISRQFDAQLDTKSQVDSNLIHNKVLLTEDAKSLTWQR